MSDKHYLIGTAGHVDHGKSMLIRALSGIETDRLKEEKQRGISIELGFAHMALPSKKEVSIVDVPGHEKFVRQMLAGATGMDLVLLVIAADEGIMPQTKEHLNILDLLGISRGIVVLNKIDLVDNEWLELIEEEIKQELKESSFRNAPICRVSAVTGIGISSLKETIDKLLFEAESKKTSGPVRMPIDRVFSIQGFGTVITGTLHSGKIAVGEELILEPESLNTKVRTVQVHGQKVNEAYAGQRVAVNITGIEVGQIKHGSELVSPNVYKVGNIIDLKISNLPESKAIKHRQRVRFHLGTSETLGRLHLLEGEELQPGKDGYAQIILEAPILAVNGDRFVLRFYSPPNTIAGGKILGVANVKQKRFSEKAIASFKLRDQGDPLDLITRECSEPLSVKELSAKLQIPTTELQEMLQQLVNNRRIDVWKKDSEKLFWTQEEVNNWREKIVLVIGNYIKSFPLRIGLGREELKSKIGIKWTNRRWQEIIEEGYERGFYKLAGSKVSLNENIPLPPEISKKLDRLIKLWKDSGLMPPDLETACKECGISLTETTEYANYLCDKKEWINLNGLYFSSTAIQMGKTSLLDHLQKYGEISVGEARELWGVSRKFTVPLLEYFDQQHITRRNGDKRILY